MPAIALVGAYASISAGIAAGAATVLGGLQIAAGVMTGLGAITGNKKLMTIGAIASLGAGAYSALGGGTSSAAASGIESVGGEGVTMGTAAGNAGSNAAEMGLSDLSGASDIGAVSSAVPASEVVGTSIGDAGKSLYELDGTATTTAQPPGGLVQQALSPQSQPQGLVSNAIRSGTSGTGGGVPQREVPKGTGFFDGVLDKLSAGAGYLKANPEVTKLGVATVGGLAGSYMKQQEIEEAVHQANLKRARYNASIINQRS